MLHHNPKLPVWEEIKCEGIVISDHCQMFSAYLFIAGFAIPVFLLCVNRV